ncbi:hypothetical protein PIB30_051406 [Stylosanthes scabra]|uniref:Uncharacterized protein n=1 Tax=Stylosanthes scabra TaxID=79078 RepID=A0ABU6WFZ9_9FABA|nr:hypothetical protein [Stylosanthes scabra]
MPPKMGELKQLKPLNLFIVDSKARHGLAELNNLKLGGRLHIKGEEMKERHRGRLAIHFSHPLHRVDSIAAGTKT